LLLSAACQQPVAATVADHLTVVQGNLQVAPVGTLLPAPVVMRVYSADGKPMPQVPVSFAVTAGGGTVDPATAISDASGEVKAKWTVGPTLPVQTLTVSAPGVNPVTLGATAIIPTDITIAQGQGQTAKAGTALINSILIRVTGGANVPIPNQTVTFSVTSGGGSFAPATGVTNALGELSVKWTLGPVLGAQTASIATGILPSITLMAVAN
jgi:hypothetical protein